MNCLLDASQSDSGGGELWPEAATLYSSPKDDLKRDHQSLVNGWWMAARPVKQWLLL